MPRSRRRHSWLLVGLLSAVLMVPETAAAQADLVPNAWNFFEWFAPGPVEGDGFFLRATGRTQLRVTDTFVAGDVFDLFVNGVLFATSSSVPSGVETESFDGESAWANPQLGKAEIFLDPGEYLIALEVRQTPEGYDFGEGYLRADLAEGPTEVVPEPVSMLLLGTGLAGVAAARRRRGKLPAAVG